MLILSGSVTENEFHSRVFLHPVQLRWGECDPAGIIFYPTYFLWFDAAAWNMFALVGYHAKRMRTEHRSMPLVAAGCEFKHPAEQEDRCEVRSRIARWGGKSFIVVHDVVRMADEKLLATGSETRVWGRYENGPGTPLKGQAIGDDLKELFKAK